MTTFPTHLSLSRLDQLLPTNSCQPTLANQLLPTNSCQPTPVCQRRHMICHYVTCYADTLLKGIYFESWKRITIFANEISTKLLARFSKEDFIDALDIIDPRQWKQA
jgi:hypothetical protein